MPRAVSRAWNPNRQPRNNPAGTVFVMASQCSMAPSPDGGLARELRLALELRRLALESLDKNAGYQAAWNCHLCRYGLDSPATIPSAMANRDARLRTPQFSKICLNWSWTV
jgi:hypothetical protein